MLNDLVENAASYRPESAVAILSERRLLHDVLGQTTLPPVRLEALTDSNLRS